MWNILKYKNVRYFLSIRVWGIKLHFASVFLSFFYHICSKTWVEYFQCSRKKKRWASFNYCFMPLSECHLLLVNQMVRYCTYKNGWFLPFRLSKWYLFSFVHQKFKTYLLFFFFFSRITPEKYDSLSYLPVITAEWSTDTRNHVSVLLLTKKIYSKATHKSAFLLQSHQEPHIHCVNFPGILLCKSFLYGLRQLTNVTNNI